GFIPATNPFGIFVAHTDFPKRTKMAFGCALEEGIKNRGSDSHGWNILPDSRTLDIGELKMSAFSSQRLADGVAHSQSRSWEKGWGRVQFLAEFGDHSRAMNRALCGQRDAQFLMSHLDVCPAG